MKQFISCVMLTTVMASSAVFAKPQSSEIDFGPGTILKAGSYDIPLSKLVDNIHYNLTCELFNPSLEGIIMGVSPYYLLPNPMLVPGDNTIKINNITNGSGNGMFPNQVITFTNSDQDFDLKIEDCKAVAIS